LRLIKDGYYVEALKKKKEEADEQRKLKAAKWKSSEKVEELEEKKNNIKMSARNEIENLDSEIKKLV